jgi:indolepyruvate ferredoxin oxidoreductase alpha subunit
VRPRQQATPAAVEAGVGSCPAAGHAASEIGDSFAGWPGRRGAFEWSVNEKVALERAFGASLAGARTLVFMKHLGLVYAGDPLSTMPYIGVVGGMVIVSAADPGMVVSPNEHDQRHLARCT